MVSLDWLVDCDREKKRLPENDYDSTQAKTWRKRGMQPPSGATPAPTIKKRRRSDASATTPAAVDETAATDESRPMKKLKEDQKDASKALVIPVDEACNLAGQSPLIFFLIGKLAISEAHVRFSLQ